MLAEYNQSLHGPWHRAFPLHDFLDAAITVLLASTMMAPTGTEFGIRDKKNIPNTETILEILFQDHDGIFY